MPDYSNNSVLKIKQDTTEEKKPIEKAIKGKAVLKKRNKVTDIFFSQDINAVKSYVFIDVIVPAIKKAVLDVIQDGAAMLIYGETRPSSKKNSGSRFSYDKVGSRSIYNSQLSRSRGGFDFEGCVLESRGDAEDVLTSMYEILDRYHVVSVSDFCELVGVSGKFTDNKFGWYDLRDVYIQRNRDGYILKLPKPEALD